MLFVDDICKDISTIYARPCRAESKLCSGKREYHKARWRPTRTSVRSSRKKPVRCRPSHSSLPKAKAHWPIQIDSYDRATQSVPWNRFWFRRSPRPNTASYDESSTLAVAITVQSQSTEASPQSQWCLTTDHVQSIRQLNTRLAALLQHRVISTCAAGARCRHCSLHVH
jgi:hypothetical protein